LTHESHGSSHDVKAWIAEALSEERLYRDGEPTWDEAETPEEAWSIRATVRFLENNSEKGKWPLCLRKSDRKACQLQFFWPDGERRRSYEITFPRD
jgi:hypothetical protein